MFCGIKSYNEKCLSFGLDTTQPGPTIVFPLVYCPVDDMLPEVSQDFRCFRCVKSLLLLWKPRSRF